MLQRSHFADQAVAAPLEKEKKKTDKKDKVKPILKHEPTPLSAIEDCIIVDAAAAPATAGGNHFADHPPKDAVELKNRPPKPAVEAVANKEVRCWHHSFGFCFYCPEKDHPDPGCVCQR